MAFENNKRRGLIRKDTISKPTMRRAMKQAVLSSVNGK
jgi:hypothetical protein